MADDKDFEPHQYASPACLAHEIDPAYRDPLAVDPQQAVDVARWRKAERARLLGVRAAVPVADRQLAGEVIADRLDAYLGGRHGTIAGKTISAWWPIKAELNLCHWLQGLAAQGARAALPVVVKRAAPLAFRVWTADTSMVRGIGNIPVPAEGAEVVPDIMLVPVVGWDDAGYRLGYGCGYVDRTLAALPARPLVIGIGLDNARITTIFPQPYDIAMTAIITETGLQELHPC